MQGLMLFIGWLMGIFLGTQLIAAYCSIIDLHYRLARSRYIIAGRILGWSGSCLIIYVILPPPLQNGLINGMQFITIVFLLTRFITTLVNSGFSKKSKKLYRQYLKELGQRVH